MKIILDLFILGVILFSIIMSYKKGFVKSLFSSFGFIAAVLIALLLTTPISGLLNNAFIYDKTYDSVEAIMQKVEGESNPEEAATHFENENPQLGALLSNMGFDITEVFEQIDDQKDFTSPEVIEKIATPAAKIISNVFAFLISIAIAYIGFFVLTKLFDLLSKLPVFNITNKTLGLIYGIFLGIFRASIYAVMISGLYPFVVGIFTDNPEIVNAVSNTYLLNFFVNNNLITLLLSSIF